MFKTLKNALKTPDVRRRLLYTLLLIVVFRLGCYITVPGVDSIALNEAMGNTEGIAGLIDIISGGAFSRLLIDIISGGAFSRFSVFAMSISPYITASIVIQLLTFIIPSLERLAKEGGEVGKQKINKYTKILTLVLALVESIGILLTFIIPSLERLAKEGGEVGKQKINKYTKILTLVLALVESIGIYFSYKSTGIFVDNSFLTGALVVIGLVAGTSILMWLGEQITSTSHTNQQEYLLIIVS